MKFLKNIIEVIPTPVLAIGGGLLILLIVSFSIFNINDDKGINDEVDTEENEQEVTVSENIEEQTASDENEELRQDEEEEEISDGDTVTNTQRKTIESTVNNFSKSFLNLDSQFPEKSIEKSEVYMTEELYEEQKNFRYEGSWDEYKVKHEDINIDVLPEVQNQVFKVAVESKGQAYDEDNNKTKTKSVVLLLDVVKQGNSYQIDNISYETHE